MAHPFSLCSHSLHKPSPGSWVAKRRRGVLNDSPGDCQTRGVTEPQRDRCHEVTDEGWRQECFVSTYKLFYLKIYWRTPV